MKKLIILFIMLFLSAQQAVWANAKVQLEKVNTDKKVTNPAFEQKSQETLEIKKEKTPEKVTPKTPETLNKTNYQYDEDNYHYYKVKKYIQNNLDYSQSGRMKY